MKENCLQMALSLPVSIDLVVELLRLSINIYLDLAKLIVFS